MSYGLYDYNRRYRRRVWTRLFKLLLWVLLLGGVAGFSYMVGVEQLKSRQGSLETDLADLTAAKEKAERRVAQLQQIAQAQEIRANEAEIRLQRELPTGELARLKDLIAKRMAEGVDPARLAFVIEQTSAIRSCSPAEVKRFVLPTPIYRGSNTSVAFADGRITVSGEGVPARNTAGAPEAWYDPGKPVTVTFSEAEGQPVTATGLLPLQRSIVLGNKEYRFTVSPGARSFVEVTATTCSFP